MRDELLPTRQKTQPPQPKTRNMASLVEKIDWNRLAYSEASKLPSVLRQIGVARRWHPGTPKSMESLWEQVGFAAFDAGVVSDAAYAILPCLLDMAEQQHRLDQEVCLVLGYLLDSTLDAVAGSPEIPLMLHNVFDEGLRRAQKLATACNLADLPSGLQLKVVAARLLSPADLPASYLVQGLSVDAIAVRCQSCDQPMLAVRDDDTWAVANGRGRLLPGYRDSTWEECIHRALAPWESLSSDLAAIQHLEGHLVCHACGCESLARNAIACAMKQKCRVLNLSGWSIGVERLCGCQTPNGQETLDG